MLSFTWSALSSAVGRKTGCLFHWQLWFLIHNFFFLTYRRLECKCFIKWLIYHACGLSRWALFITWKVLLLFPDCCTEMEKTSKLAWRSLPRRCQWLLCSWLGATGWAGTYHFFFLAEREKAERIDDAWLTICVGYWASPMTINPLNNLRPNHQHKWTNKQSCPAVLLLQGHCFLVINSVESMTAP